MQDSDNSSIRGPPPPPVSVVEEVALSARPDSRRSLCSNSLRLHPNRDNIREQQLLRGHRRSRHCLHLLRLRGRVFREGP